MERDEKTALVTPAEFDALPEGLPRGGLKVGQMWRESIAGGTAWMLGEVLPGRSEYGPNDVTLKGWRLEVVR